uniref:Uncharacterized protein n=1 Tax=Piliocolobus tephrosceles TaxID=591936 RepID=A0A8C9I8R0_9PRIM
MAQMVHSLCSTFGLQCCLLFLLASWEAGANTFQEYQKTGELSTSDHIFPLPPGLVYSIPLDHTVNSGQRPSELPKSTEIHERKRHCNTTCHSKPTDKPIDNSKTTDYKSSTDNHEDPPSSEENSSNQGKDPMIRNQRSVDPVYSATTHEESSEKKHTTPAPKSKISCHKSTTGKSMVTRKPDTTGRPLEKSMSILDNKSTTSFHNSGNSQTKPKKTCFSEKTTAASKTTYKTTGTPEESEKPEDYRTTVASDKLLTKTTKNIHETISANEAQSLAKPTEHRERTASEKTTPSPAEPTENGQRTPFAKKTRSTKEKNTPVPEKPTENPRNTTLTTETIKAPVKSTENPEKTVAVTKTRKPPVKVAGNESLTTASSHLNKTEVIHQVPTGSFTLTTRRMKLSSITSETPGTSHPHLNKNDSQNDIHAGQMGENDSFPAWAIVIVVLVAVILLLVFLGLVFLVRDRCDNDPEDEGGPNSYPVYLMEQQNLGMGQIPSPR